MVESSARSPYNHGPMVNCHEQQLFNHVAAVRAICGTTNIHAQIAVMRAASKPVAWARRSDQCRCGERDLFEDSQRQTTRLFARASYPAQAKIHQSRRNRDERRTISHAHGRAAPPSDSLSGSRRRMNLMHLSCATSRGRFCFSTKEV